MVSIGAAFTVKLFDGRLESVKGGRVIKFTRNEANSGRQLLPNFFRPRGTGVLLNSCLYLFTEVLVGPIATGKTDLSKAWWQQATVCQVVNSWHQLFT